MGKVTKVWTLFIAVGLIAVMWAAGPQASAYNQESHAHSHDQETHEHSHAPASAKKLKNPLKATEANIESGRALYNKNCASCHGEDGKATTDIASGMKVKPADLTSLHARTDGEIYWVINNGIKKSGMPAFSTKAKANERWQMTLYVKHLMGEHPHAGGEKH